MVLIKKDAIVGCLLGTAVGDSMGLPYEGLSKHRQQKIYRSIKRQSFLFNGGMVSDDTEHICMVTQAIIKSVGQTSDFSKYLASAFKKWILSLPAGVGWATLRSCFKLLAGFNPLNSGVYSAGNGPAMRSAIVGISFGDKPGLLMELVRLSTRITHTDPRAENGALAVAIAAFLSSDKKTDGVSSHSYYELLQQYVHDTIFLDLICKCITSISNGENTQIFAASLGLEKGVSGYIYHTVPVVIHAWLRYPNDFRSAVIEIIRCGGDTDTTAAILGGIIGAGVGKTGIPAEWLNGVSDWPMTVKWIEKLGNILYEALEQNHSNKPPELFYPFGLLRNFFFAAVVLMHGLRRLFPPY